MNAQDVKLLNDIYVRTLKTGKKLYMVSEKHNDLKSAQKLESYVTYLGEMNEKIKTILDLTCDFADQCLERASDIREIIDFQNYDGDPSRMFAAHANKYKNMSWADISDIEEHKEQVIESVDDVVAKTITKTDYSYMPILYKTISNIYGTNLGCNFRVPIISRIDEMPSSLYWFNGNSQYAPGVYICLSRGFYVQVPFPNVVDSTRDFNRTGSIKCKYHTLKDCHKVREDLARKYNSEIRACNFAHEGDKYVKIGTSFRCTSIPRFGNYANLREDLDKVSESDINTILMYALSDVLLTSIWAQKHRRNDILTDIDIC